MHISSVARASALAATLALLALSGSPAMAATTVAQASATGLTLSIAGSGTNTGVYKATNDGEKETVTGSNQPAISLLGNQNFLAAGTLAQNATTAVDNGNGTSAACSGVAGQGASLAAVSSGNCLVGGNALNLTAAQLDLDKIAGVQLVAGQGQTSITGLLTALGLQAQVAPVLAQLQAALDQAVAPLADSGLVLSAGVIQSSCTAAVGTAQGTANIANAGAYLQLPGVGGAPATRIDLLNFPASPAPNTQVVVDLDKVLNVLVDALKTSLTTSAAGPLGALLGPLLGPGLPVVQQLQDQLITAVVGQVSDALQPLNDNVLNITLNKQSKASPDQITVTALDLNVLPIAAQQLGSPLVSAQIATSSCGPNGRVVAPAVASATPTPKAPSNPKPTPKVPTSIPAGLADAPTRNAPLGPWALGGLGVLLAASVGAGATAYRKSSARI